MTVWIVNPFDNLPTEGFRPQRYWLMAEAFARAGHRVVCWTSDFNHGTKAKRIEKVGGESRCMRTAEGLDSDCEFAPCRNVESVERGNAFEVVEIPTRPYPKNVCLARVRSHRQLARDFEKLAQDRISPVDAVAHRVHGESASAALKLGEGGSFSPVRDGDRPPLARRVSASTGTTPDLIVASTPPLGLCDAARRVAKRCGAKFVCDIQDAWPETFARLLPRGLKWLGAILFAPMRRTARRLYREADLVTGVSARYQALAARDDFYLAYHGISAYGEAGMPPLRRCGILPHRLVYIGNLGAGYDLETVIDAVARRDDLTLDIAGRGPREPALRARVASLGLSSRVRFHGYLDEASLRALLARCDVGVIPMRDDSWVGLPYKLGDYLKAGLPVVSSLRGECGALLERTGFGRVYASGNAASLLAALADLRPVPVSLPPELRAEEIYSRYASHVSQILIRERMK